MDDSSNEYDNENASVSIKPEPEVFYETHDGANCRSVNCSLEHMDEGDDLNNSTNKSRRRSRRTRVRNVRYRSDDDNVIALSPENIRQNGKNSDKDFLVQEPSSSTARRGTCPKNNDVTKSKHMSVNNSMGEILRQIGLYDELFDFMDSRGITAEALKYMKTRHIDELFKDTHLDTKIIFEHRLIDWQNKIGNCEVTTTQSSNNNVNNLVEQKSSEMVFSNLSKVLTHAVQQTINTVLQEFRQAYLNQTKDKSNIFSSEVPNERIPLKNIKSEPNQGTVDEIIIPDKTPNSVVRQTSNKVKNEILLSNRSIDLTISNQSKRRKVDSDISVQEILIASSGQHLFDEYEKTRLLTVNDRSELVHCIVDFFIRNKLVLTIARCKEIAEEIVQLFPTESTGTYFIQANKNRPPKGKIWERYQSRKRTILKSVPVNSRPETLKTDTSPSDLEDLCANKADWSEMQAMCSQMKHITDDKELLAKWRESFAFRRHQLQTGTFSNWKLYFDEYPFCKQQNYAEFIESDLEALYPDLKFNDFLWDEFMENFSTYFLNRIKHPKSKHLYDQLTSMENLSTSTDYVAIKVIELLHATLKPYTDKIQSSEVAQRKFTVEVTDLSDLKKVVIERKKYCTEHNIQAKPYIAVVGQSKTYSNFSVILDSTGFSCDNYKDSLILCFNLYLFFDISFPLEFLNVWGFIQKYFFDKPLLVNNPRVETFINDLRAQKLASLDIKTTVNGKKLHKDF